MKYGNIDDVFANALRTFRPVSAQTDDALIAFDFSQAGLYWLRVKQGTCQVGKGTSVETPNVIIRSTAEDWVRISNGELNPMAAILKGKLKIEGSMSVALKIQSWFGEGSEVHE